MHHALSKGIYYRVTVSRKDFRALPEDLFRSFLRIRGKDIWWDQNFLANRVRVAKSDKSEKAVTGWNIFFLTSLTNLPLVPFYEFLSVLNVDSFIVMNLLHFLGYDLH